MAVLNHKPDLNLRHLHVQVCCSQQEHRCCWHGRGVSGTGGLVCFGLSMFPAVVSALRPATGKTSGPVRWNVQRTGREPCLPGIGKRSYFNEMFLIWLSKSLGVRLYYSPQIVGLFLQGCPTEDSEDGTLNSDLHNGPAASYPHALQIARQRALLGSMAVSAQAWHGEHSSRLICVHVYKEGFHCEP